MVEKRPALGRGLSALIPDLPAAAPDTAARALEVDTDLLRPNKFQPRTQMDEDRIEELARSIKSNGIIQPIVVRRSGHRVRDRRGEQARRPAPACSKCPSSSATPDDRLLAVALIENIQRRPESDRRGRRAPPARGRIPPDAGTDRGCGGKDRLVDRQLRAAAASAAEVARERRRERASMGHARAARAVRRGLAAPRRPRRRRAQSLVRETSAVKKAGSGAEKKEAKKADVHTRAAEDKPAFPGTRPINRREGWDNRDRFVDEDELQRLYEKLTGD